MGSISKPSRDHTMRVLILSAILACAAAAPSGVLLAAVPVVPAAAPTLSPGDLQAAAIDAQVKLNDQARALADQAQLAADQARDLAEQALENHKETTEEQIDTVKEKNVEQFWNVEDKKWQAIDAVKTVEAKLDGAVASNADAIAKSLTFPIVAPLNPVLTPYAPVVLTKGLIPLAQPINNDKLVKTAEENKDTKPAEGESMDKAEQPKLEGLALAPQPIIAAAPWVQAPITYYQPGLLGAPVPLQPVLTPAVLKQW